MDGEKNLGEAIRFLTTLDDRVKNLDALDYGLIKWSAFITGALWGAHLSGMVKRRRFKLFGIALAFYIRPTVKLLLIPPPSKK